jgi:transcriptional regulator CtsR
MSDPHGTIGIYRKGGGIMKIESLDVLKAKQQMSESFVDTIAEHITGAMQQEIGEELFDNWANNNLDEGEEYAEHAFMAYASTELKQQYNEYYGYTEKDEYYLC